MDITESKAGSSNVAALHGRLDAGTVPAVEPRLLGMLDAGAKLVADMTEVNYVSSAGLRLLLKAAKHAKSVGAAFALAAPQDSVREVLVISGFDKILQIHPTRDAAVTGLG